MSAVSGQKWIPCMRLAMLLNSQFSNTWSCLFLHFVLMSELSMGS